jgi:hypothetical protein
MKVSITEEATTMRTRVEAPNAGAATVVVLALPGIGVLIDLLAVRAGRMGWGRSGGLILLKEVTHIAGGGEQHDEERAENAGEEEELEEVNTEAYELIHGMDFRVCRGKQQNCLGFLVG